MPHHFTNSILATLLTLSALVPLATGCSKSVRTHPVSGQVKLAGGDAAVLAGHTLEIALDSNRLVRAAGEIQPDGTFALQTVQGSAVLEGALPGEYQARIVLSDDDPARRTAAAKSIPARYFQFERSGLALRVPSEQGIKLDVKQR